MLEAVLLASTTARGHEVVCPPAAEREVKAMVRAASVCGQARSLQCQEAMLRGLGPEWGSLSKGHSPWHSLPLGSWLECGGLGTFS